MARIAGHLSILQLAVVVLKELLSSCSVGPEEVEEVILGQVSQSPVAAVAASPPQVLGGGHGQNPARQAALGAGLPNTRYRLYRS